MVDSIQSVTRSVNAVDVQAALSPSSTSFAEVLAGSVGAPQSASTASTTFVDNGPGGSGAVLQLDGNGRILCMCPECVAARQAAASPGEANPMATATAPATSTLRRVTSASDNGPMAGVKPLSVLAKTFSTASIESLRAEFLLGRGVRGRPS